jgi:Protein involved in D-alanine esterification of lipoteichoic acid and wall teichoic acid (D-alanine transfer protein)
MPHLCAGLIASGLVATVLFAAGMVAVHREHTTILSSAPELFPLKNQGLAFQRAAAYAPNVLPLYGSSELTAECSTGERAAKWSPFPAAGPFGYMHPHRARVVARTT